MALKFKGATIKCGELHSQLHKICGEYQVQRTYFWGLSGTSEIRSGMGPERIECDCWINDNFTGSNGPTNLINELFNLDGKRGEHGTVQTTGDITEFFNNCTFEGAFRIALPGQQRPTMVELCDGTGWTQAVTLVWTCLLDD